MKIVQFRKLLSVILLAGMLLSMVPAVPASAATAPVDMMESHNPGFEGEVVDSLAPNWYAYGSAGIAEVNYGITTDSANVCYGSQSAWLSKNAGESGVGIVSDNLAVTAGQSYFVEVLVKGSGYVSIYASFRDASNQEIGNTILMDKDLNDSWRTAGGTATAPENAAYMAILIYIKGDYTTTVYCDNVFVCINDAEYVCYQLQRAVQSNDKNWFENLLKSEMLGIDGLRNGYMQHYFLAVKEMENITAEAVRDAIKAVNRNPVAVMDRALDGAVAILTKTATVTELGTVEIPQEAVSATASYEGTNLYWSGAAANEWLTFRDGQLLLNSRPDVGAEDASVQLILTMELEGAKKTVEYTVSVPAYASEQEQYFAQVSFDAIKGSNTDPGFVTSNLELPAQIGGKDVLWSSSDPDVIGANGTVARPAGSGFVPVTLTATPADAAAEEENTPETTEPAKITVEMIDPAQALAFTDIAHLAEMSFSHEAHPDSLPNEMNTEDAVDGDGFLSLSDPTLPQEFVWTWTEAQSADLLKIYCNWAQDQSPAAVEVYTKTADGDWVLSGGGDLLWQTSSAEFECATVPFTGGENITAFKLVVTDANLTWGAYGINKVHITHSATVYDQAETKVINASQSLTFTDLASSAQLTYSHEANAASQPEAVNSADAVNGNGFVSLANPELPQELTFTWDAAQTANALKLYCYYAKDQSPAKVQIQVMGEDGQWVTAAKAVLPWQTSSGEFECATIPFTGGENITALKLIVEDANLTWGAYGINKIHIYQVDASAAAGEMSASVNVLVAPVGAEEGTSIAVENADLELSDEAGVADWQLLTGKIYPDGTLSLSKDAFTGRHSLQITATGGSSAATAYSNGILGIRDGYTYVAGVAAKGDGTLAPKVTVKFYNMYSMECGSFSTSGTADKEWQYLSVSALAPAGAVFARVLVGGASTAAGTVVADTVSFRELPLITGFTAVEGQYISNAIAAQPGLTYTVSGGSAVLRFADNNGKVLLESDALTVIAPTTATTVYVLVSDTTNVALSTAPTGTQTVDGSFESLGAGSGSDWEVAAKVETVFSEDFENGDQVWTVHPAYANVFLTEENDGTYDFLRVNAPVSGKGGGAYSYAVPATAGVTYTVTLTYKSPINPSIYCYSRANTDVVSGATISSANQNIQNGTDSWLTKSVDYTVASGATHMNLLVYIGGSSAPSYIDLRSVVIKNKATGEIVENMNMIRGWNYYTRPATDGTCTISYTTHTNNATTVANFTTGATSNGFRSPVIPVTAGETYQVAFGYSSHKKTSVQIEYWQESGPTDEGQWNVTKYSLDGYNGFKNQPAISTTAPEGAIYMTVLFYDQYYNLFVDNVRVTKTVSGGDGGSTGNSILSLEGGQATQSAVIPVLAGKEYTAVVRANSTVSGGVKLTMTWYNLNGTVLGSESVVSTQTGTDELLKINKVLPIDSCNVRLTLEAVDGTVVFDDADIFAISDTVSNASFEDLNAYHKSGNFPIQWRTYGSVSAHTVSGEYVPDSVLALEITGISGGGVRSGMIRATAGTEYFARIQASSTQGGSLKLSFFDEDFDLISGGTAAAFSGSGWNSYSVTAAAPEGTAYAALDLTAAAGDSFTVDCAEFSTAVIHVGQNTQMFIDDYILISADGFQRTFHQAEKSDVIMRDEDNVPLWERNGNYLYGTVLYDEQDGLYKMWYSGNNPGYNGGGDSRSVMTCYAESTDGVNWTRPNLGVWEYNGSTDNNIIGNYHIASVGIDYNAPAEQRYTMITYTHDLHYSQLYSADGVNWTKAYTTAGGDVITAAQLENGGYYGLMKWCGTTRRDFHTITFDTIDNIETCVMANSLADSLDAQETYRADSYGMGLYEKDGTYIGFNWLFYIPGTNHMEGIIENQLTFSRDLTEQWQRPTRTPIIPLGENGSIDDGMIFTASNAIEIGDEVWMYCGAWDGDHVYGKRSCFSYIAKWRMDGFASLDAGSSGTLVTKPMTVAGGSLQINANAVGGSLYAELLDAEGNPIAGFTKADCDPITTDSISHTVAWNGSSDLSALTGQTVTLKLYAENTELYSFRFAEGTATEEQAELKVSQWNISLGDDLTLNFHIQADAAIAAQASVKICAAGNEIVSGSLTEAEQNENGSYVFHVDMAAAQMTDAVSVELLLSGGSKSVSTYTVEQYAKTVLSDESLSQYHSIVREMLGYGAAAQTYFDYNTDNAIDESLYTGAGSNEISGEGVADMTVSGEAQGIALYGASLLFQTKTAVRFYFTAENDMTGYTFWQGDQLLMPVQKDGMWYVDVENINPQALNEAVTVTVTSESGELSVSYSPMNYIVRMNGKGSDSLKALLKALYNYHLAAKKLA